MDYVLIKNILNSVSDCLMVLDPEGRVLYANEASEEILGRRHEDLRGKLLLVSLLGTKRNSYFHQLLTDAMEKGSVHDYVEVDYHHPDGTIRKLAATTSYLLGPDPCGEDFLGFVAQFKDITEVSNLRREEAELLQEKAKVAREKIESLRKLAMGVAHEIRNPVVSIGGFAARIARKETISKEIREYTDHIIQAAERLEKLVNDVDQCCSLPPPNLTDGDLSGVVGKVVEEMSPSADKRHIKLVVHDAAPTEHRCRFDSRLIAKATQALLDNAIYFSQDGGQVTILLGQRDGAAVIEVQDSGSGIPARDLDFVFDPFFSTRPQASGLGLTLVERVVQEHTGRIEVESAPGAGTTVRILLPCRSL